MKQKTTTTTNPLIVVIAGLAISAATAEAQTTVFADNFEAGANSYGGTTPDVTSYTVANTSGQANTALWVRASSGFNSSRNGLIDESENGGLNFNDPVGSQAYAFRYTNAGVTTAAGKLGALTWGTTITVSFDVCLDGWNGGGPYNALLVLFDAGAVRNSVEVATNTTAAVLAQASGTTTKNSLTDNPAYQTISFSYTVGNNVVDNNGAGGGAATGFLYSLLGKDIALRFAGATSSANIDNVSVVIDYSNVSFWDIDGATAGAGGATPAGTWNAGTTNWNPDPAGTGTAAAWGPGDFAVFAAGADATGSYTVTVDGPQNIKGVVVEEGSINIANGTSGALNMTSNSDVLVPSGSTVTIGTPLTDADDTQVLQKVGSGLLVLSADNSAANGGIQIAAGTIQFESPASINGTAENVTIASGGTLVFGSGFGAGNIPAALADRIVTTSAGTIAADNYAATNFDFNTPALTAARLGALGSVSYSGTLTPEGTTYRLGGGGGTLTMANANALTGTGYSAVISGNVTLPLANNLDGSVTLNSGLLKIGNNGSLGSGTLVINGGRISSTDTTARTLANALDVNANMALGDATNTGILTFSSGVDITGGTRTFTTSSDVEFAGIVSGASALTKAGTGVLTLSGDNTYNGTTTVDAGTLVLSGSNSSAGATTLNGATLQLDSDSNGGLASGLLTISQNAGVLQAINADRVIANNVSLNSSPTISGSQSLTINGTMTLNNNRTLTNSISGSGKLLTIASITRDGTNNRNLTVAGAGNTTVTGGVTLGTGTLTKSDAGTLTLQGANSYTGATAVNTGGTLALVGGSQDSVITVNNGAFLGFTLGSPTTSTKALNLNTGHAIRITGAPTLGSYTLITAASIGGTGTPTLEAPISGYELVVDGTSLKLNSTGGGSAYDTWAASKGLTGASGSATDPAKDADPDKDGSNNLSEFAFNGDPLSGSDNGKVYVLTEDSDFAGDPSAAKELILTIAVRTGTPVFAGSPSPSATQATDGITYRIEGSLDLAGFPTTVNVVPTPVIIGLPVDPGTGYVYRSFSLDGSDGLSGKGFLRAKVTSP